MARYPGIGNVGGGFSYEAHSGGYILRDANTGREVFIQPGDDAQVFADEMNATNNVWTDQDVIEQYFLGMES